MRFEIYNNSFPHKRYQMAEEQQLPTLPEALDARLTAQVNDALQHWAANATEEEKQVDRAFMASMQESPEAMQKMMTEASADFAAADANGDGVLDLAEYTVFHNGQIATWKARGHFVDEREDQIAATFGILDDFNGETQGISEADYMAMMGIWMAKFEALKHTVEGGAAAQ